MSNPARKALEKKSNRTTVYYIAAIMLLSTILRLVFILMTPYNISPHDLGKWPDPNNLTCYGHLGYTAFIYYVGILPNSDPRLDYAIYNPPLHYIINACWLHFLSLFTDTESTILEGLQWLTCLYVTGAVFFIYKTFDRIFDEAKRTIICTAIIAFHPFFIFTAGFVGNDALSIFFTCATLYFTVCWYQEQKTSQIFLAALCLGLGMMTKLNVVLLAPAMAYFFLLKLIERIKEKKKENLFALIKQYAGFLLISVPLGTWWSFRNLIRFNLPLGYIDTPSDQNYKFISDHSFVNRYIPKYKNLITPFVEPHVSKTDGDTCIYWSVLKQSLFSNQKHDQEIGPFWTKVALVFMYIVFAAVLVALVLSIIRSIKGIKAKDHYIVFCWIGIATYLASFLPFCYKYPFVCTQDFRYIWPTFILLLITFKRPKEMAQKKDS